MTNTETDKNVQLYVKAKQRVNFKIHITVFLLLMAIAWLIWGFIFKDSENQTFLKCLTFASLIWGIILIAHYLIVYKWNKSLVDKELQKLIEQENQKLEEIERLKNKETEVETTEEIEKQ